jgi:hypothetical protein
MWWKLEEKAFQEGEPAACVELGRMQVSKTEG